MKLEDILNRKGRGVVTADANGTIRDAVRTLMRHNIGALAVVDGSGKLVGMFSERDVLRLSDRDVRPDFAAMRLSEHMSSEVTAVDSQMDVNEALALMVERRFRHLPILSDSKLAGMISQGDLVKAMLEDAQHETKQLAAFVTGQYPM